MTQNLKKYIILGLIISLLGMSLAWEFFPGQVDDTRLDSIITTDSNLHSRDVPLSALEKELLGEARAIKRIYLFQGQKLLVTITDGSRNRHAVHDPTYCFRGDGWTISESISTRIPGGEGRLLSLTKQDSTTTALLFFSDGDRAFHNQMTFWFKTSLRRLTLGQSGREPILIIIRPMEHENQQTDWDDIIQSFIPLLNL